MTFLERFAIARHADGYSLHFATEGGDTLDLLASFDQLDMIAEEIDRQLDADQDEAPPAHGAA